MKKKLFVLLLVVTLLGTAVPLYAQDAILTLEDLAAKVEAMVELVASMTERLTSFEERLELLEATATPTVTPTPSPTPPPTPTSTPTSPSPTVRMSGTMNVRSGPGTNYPILGQAASGDQYPISGKNPAGGWWQIIYSGQFGWVYSPFGDSDQSGTCAGGVDHSHAAAHPDPTNGYAHPADARASPCGATSGRSVRRHWRGRLQIQVAKYGFQA